MRAFWSSPCTSQTPTCLRVFGRDHGVTSTAADSASGGRATCATRTAATTIAPPMSCATLSACARNSQASAAASTGSAVWAMPATAELINRTAATVSADGRSVPRRVRVVGSSLPAAAPGRLMAPKRQLLVEGALNPLERAGLSCARAMRISGLTRPQMPMSRSTSASWGPICRLTRTERAIDNPRDALPHFAHAAQA